MKILEKRELLCNFGRVILDKAWCSLRKKHQNFKITGLTEKMGSLGKMWCAFRIYGDEGDEASCWEILNAHRS